MNCDRLKDCCADVWGPRCASIRSFQRLSFALSLSWHLWTIPHIIISIFKYIAVGFEQLSFSEQFKKLVLFVLFWIIFVPSWPQHANYSYTRAVTLKSQVVFFLVTGTSAVFQRRFLKKRFCWQGSRVQLLLSRNLEWQPVASLRTISPVW